MKKVMYIDDIEDIKIEHFIVHILDNKKSEMVLSDSEISVSGTVRDFLNKYIEYTLENSGTKVARFNRPENLVENMCNAMLRDLENNFVIQSQEIAKHLYSIMEKDKKISEGDLLICTYSTETLNFPVVAVFKIDLTTAHFHSVTKKDGKTSIDIRPVGDAYPPAGNLQKCVFIYPPEPEEAREDYDFKILDNQIRTIEKRASVDNFFCKTFLNCKLVHDDRDRTVLFRKKTEEWLRCKEKKGELTDTDVDMIRDLSFHTLRSDIINVPNFAKVAIKNNELRQDYLKHIYKKGLHDNEFTPDPSTVQKYTKFKKFRGDHDLYVKVEAKHFDEMIEVGEIGPDNKRTIIIRTTNWREVDR